MALQGLSLRELRDNAVLKKICVEHYEQIDSVLKESAGRGQSYIEIWVVENDSFAGNKSYRLALEIPPRISGGEGNAGTITIANFKQLKRFVKGLEARYSENEEITIRAKTEDSYYERINDTEIPNIVEIRW